jgi:hypothetical protein
MPGVPKFGYFRRFGLLGVLALLFIARLIGQHLAAGGDPSLEFNAPAALPPTSGLVDQSPLLLARQLASQVTVPRSANMHKMRCVWRTVRSIRHLPALCAAPHPSGSTPHRPGTQGLPAA